MIFQQTSDYFSYTYIFSIIMLKLNNTKAYFFVIN